MDITDELRLVRSALTDSESKVKGLQHTIQQLSTELANVKDERDHYKDMYLGSIEDLDFVVNELNILRGEDYI